MKRYILFSVTLFLSYLLNAQTFNVPSSGNNTWTTCSGTLYDSGGSGSNYATSSNGYTVIYPATTGLAVSLSGSYNLENGYDNVMIYDGIGTGGTLLGSYSGSGTMGPITSFSGPITVQLTSDGSVCYTGFSFTVSCATPATPPDPGTIHNVPSSGNDSWSTCDGHLYDAGGANGNYLNSSNGYTVLNPTTTGSNVIIQGTFYGEGCCDYLYIYDGIGTGGTLLATIMGNGSSAINVGPFTASNGSLTVRFTSDGSVARPGFDLTVTCTDPPIADCPPADPTVTANLTNICLGNSANLSANSTSFGVNQYYWYDVATGGMPIDSGANYSVSPTASGTYTYYVEAAMNGNSTGGGTPGTPTSVSSGFTTNNGHGGVMFDLEAKACDLVVTAVDGQLNTGSGSVDFYYRTSSCQTTWGSNSGWIYLGCTTVTGMGPNVATNLQFPSSVTIPAGQRYAFCIMAQQGWKYDDGTSFGTIVLQNTDLIWYEGWGTTIYGDCTEPFSQSYVNNPRIFRGTIYYSTSCGGTVVQTCYSNRIPITITVNDIPQVSCSANTSLIDCNNASSTITANATNGSGTYSYHWNNTAANSNTNTVTTGGTYTVTVTSNTCTASSSITIDENTTIPSITIDTPDGTMINCIHSSIDAIVSGDGIYTYQWNGGATPNTANNTFYVNNNYTLLVTDNTNGCTYSTDLNITFDQNIPTATITNNTNTNLISCATETISLTASGSDEYQWSNGSTTNNINVSSSGNYIVTVTNTTNGCTASTGIVINENTLAPTVTISSNTGSFDLNCSVNTLTLTASGGNTYLWSGGYQPNQSINTFTDAGTYTVTVTNTINFCRTIDTVTITIPEPLTSNIVIDQPIMCNGDLARIQVLANGGTLPYQGTGIFNIPAGSYTYTITDKNNCISTSSITINQIPLLKVSVEQTGTIKCYGEETANLFAKAEGGILPYTYSWSNSSNTFTSNLDSIFNLAAGTYTITVKDANGCSLTNTNFVNQPQQFIMNYEYRDILCNGQNNGFLNIAPTGGIRPYQFIVSSGSNFKKYLSYYSDLRPGTYNIEVSDYNQCKHTTSVTINEPSKVEVNLATSAPSCRDSKDGSIIVDLIGGVPPYKYFINEVEYNDSTLQYMVAGTYDLIIEDFNECQSIFNKVKIDDNFEDCLLIPTAITPNGDNINDTWKIEGLELVDSYEVMVFNRWGQLLYKSTTLSDPEWDGRYKSKFVPTGTYLYVIKTQGVKERKFTGSISVIY